MERFQSSNLVHSPKGIPPKWYKWLEYQSLINLYVFSCRGIMVFRFRHICTSLRGVHSCSNAITSWSQDFDKFYISNESHQICTAGSPHLGESKGNSFTGDTDIIIPWSHETNRSLYIELWRGYGHQILKTGILLEMSIKNPSAGGNDVIISWSRGFDKFIHPVMEGLHSLNLSNTFFREVNGALLHR